MVAFVATVNGRQQVWIRLMTGGAPLQVTRDDADHLHPRWTPDSSSLIYYIPPDTSGGEGALWEVSALGGLPRPIIGALGGGDISHDGRRVALLRVEEGRLVLTTVARDGSDPETVAHVPRGHYWQSPRWSRDDAWLAFHGRGRTIWDEVLWIVPARGGERRQIAHATFMRGVSWLPNGAGLVYSASRGSTLPYPPTFNLRAVNMDGSADTQITSGDVSYVEPDVHGSGRLVVCRIRSQSDIWKCPVDGSAAENTRAMTRVTRQTGQVQTPSVSPDGSELVYLSDNGGHANLWVIRTDGTRARQITFERDPAVTIGVPKWSPAGDAIVYIVNREVPQLWIIRPDGRGARKLVERGLWAAWGEGGRWLYYTPNVDGEQYTHREATSNGRPGGSGQGRQLDGVNGREWRAVLCRGSRVGVRDHRLGNQAGVTRGRTVGVRGPYRWESRAGRGSYIHFVLVERQPMDRAGACRRCDEQPLGALDRRWIVAANHRLRRRADAHRPPGVMVAGRAVYLRLRLQEQRRHRHVRGPGLTSGPVA